MNRRTTTLFPLEAFSGRTNKLRCTIWESTTTGHKHVTKCSGPVAEQTDYDVPVENPPQHDINTLRSVQNQWQNKPTTMYQLRIHHNRTLERVSTRVVVVVVVVVAQPDCLPTLVRMSHKYVTKCSEPVAEQTDYDVPVENPPQHDINTSRSVQNQWQNKPTTMYKLRIHHNTT